MIQFNPKVVCPISNIGVPQEVRNKIGIVILFRSLLQIHEAKEDEHRDPFECGSYKYVMRVTFHFSLGRYISIMKTLLSSYIVVTVTSMMVSVDYI